MFGRVASSSCSLVTHWNNAVDHSNIGYSLSVRSLCLRNVVGAVYARGTSTARVSLRDVAKELEVQGYATPSGKQYSAAAIASMLAS
jgi:hypothetical protein